MSFHTRTTCRACDSRHLNLILSLGRLPLANSFLRDPAEFATEVSYPLNLGLCPACHLLQLLDVVSPDMMFTHYLYLSAMSDTIAEHNRLLAAELVERLSLTADSLVAEVGSNDGSLLRCFHPYGARTVGIEPATNLATMARSRGVDTVNAFLDSATAAEIVASRGRASLVVANNVLAHVEDTRAFLTACRELLAPDGMIVIESPYVRNLVTGLQYDTIYHEHQCYFSAQALVRLCDAVGLSIRRIELVPVHGGSFRLSAQPAAAARPEHAASAFELLQAERDAGFDQRAVYDDFARRVEESRRSLRALLERVRANGHSVAAYGAAAKGNTLLNYCDIDAGLVECIVDRNPLKIGLWSPGMHLPVRDVSVLVEEQPDYVLLLAWNFAPEIIAQQAAYRRRGGKFIIPIPTPTVV